MRLMISCLLGLLVGCGDKDADTAAAEEEVEVEDSAEGEDTAEE